jgi:hypothetical protein
MPARARTPGRRPALRTASSTRTAKCLIHRGADRDGKGELQAQPHLLPLDAAGSLGEDAGGDERWRTQPEDLPA